MDPETPASAPAKRRRASLEAEDTVDDTHRRSSNSSAPRRKRGRHAAACASCHRRKQRCDGAHPCFNCSRRGVGQSCTYAGLPARAHALPQSVEYADEQQDESSLSTISRTNTTVNAHSPLDHGTTRNVTIGPDERTSPSAPRETIHRRAETVSDPPECSVGDLFKSRDAPSFFGSSYFGPQAAAKVIEAPAPDLSAGLSHKTLASSTHSFRDEGGPFSQIWDLLGLLPRKKSTVDRLTELFLRELNWTIDAVRPKCFRDMYETFWSRKFGFDDFATIDLRWLALLFIVLAYGVLLDCPSPRNKDAQRELQETSLRFYWAARRAIVIAPTFYGESTDLVRAGVLVTRYLLYSRRIPESWLTTSFAMRMAQAQGMHIDGERWRLSRQKTETRRRLWSHLYTLDKTIALAIGRPFAIVDQQCLVKLPSNVWLDEMDDEAANEEPVKALSEPTLSLCNRLSHELAIIVGKIQERCFGLFTVSYDTVLALDQEIASWEAGLPAYFRLEQPDLSKDAELPFLVWNRLSLHSLYHFARVTLHRPFLLRQSITHRYRHSHDVCIASACADLAMRLRCFAQPPAQRLRWTLGAHPLFNSALVLGIIAVRDPQARRAQPILEDLAAYCEMQRNDVWASEFALAEVKVVELCVRKARQMQHAAAAAAATVHQEGPATAAAAVAPSSLDVPGATHGSASVAEGAWSAEHTTQGTFMGSTAAGPVMWDDPAYSFPETGDITQWEHILNSIVEDQMDLGVRLR